MKIVGIIFWYIKILIDFCIIGDYWIGFNDLLNEIIFVWDGILMVSFLFCLKKNNVFNYDFMIIKNRW